MNAKPRRWRMNNCDYRLSYYRDMPPNKQIGLTISDPFGYIERHRFSVDQARRFAAELEAVVTASREENE